MTAAHVFEALHDAGMSVLLAPGGKIVISPGSRLTADLRELVKVNKSLMVDWLQAANDPAPEPPADPNAWRELAAAYHAHHFACHACIAAGRGSQYGQRCGVGTALWRAYSGAS